MKKFLLSFLACLTIFFSFVPYLKPIHAQTWYSQNPVEWYLKVYDNTNPSEIFGERYTAAQVQWIVYSFFYLPIRLVAPVIGDDIVTCFFKTFSSGTLDVTNCGGSIENLLVTITDFGNKILDFVLPYTKATTTSALTPTLASGSKPLLSLIFNSQGREISGIEYAKNIVNKLSLVSEVKAQGIGYTGLDWLQKYWVGFRNIAYALLVFVVIVFAFMIMFRVKLSPQVVISVQSALPKVIVAMILITFSYAIAGFVIDLMYVVSGLFVLLLKAAGFAAANSDNAWLMISGTGFGYKLVGGFWVFFVMLGYTVMFLVAAIWSFTTTLIGGASLFGAIVALIFVVIAVWVLILMLWYTIKIPYVLLKTLISFYISVITAPVQILAGTLVPSMGFGTWLKKLMADMLVFPVTGLLFWLAWATLWSSYHQAGVDITRGIYFSDATIWAPGIIGSAADMTGLIFLAMSFGIITTIPKVPGLLKQFIMGEKFTEGSGIGMVMGGAGLAAGYAGSGLKGRASHLEDKMVAVGSSDPLYAKYEAARIRALKASKVSDVVSNAASTLGKYVH